MSITYKSSILDHSSKYFERYVICIDLDNGRYWYLIASRLKEDSRTFSYKDFGFSKTPCLDSTHFMKTFDLDKEEIKALLDWREQVKYTRSDSDYIIRRDHRYAKDEFGHNCDKIFQRMLSLEPEHHSTCTSTVSPSCNL